MNQNDPSNSDSPERTTGWRSVFSLAPVYRLAQKAIGADRFRRTLTDEIIVASTEDRLLDLGCGTADILDHLTATDYVGVDPSENYIRNARARYGNRGTFVTSAGEHFALKGKDRTIALAVGVLHHMDDETVQEMLEVASAALQTGGRFISIDPTLVDGQHWVARQLVSRDRGQHVRSPEAQHALVAQVFPNAEVEVRHDLLRTPYSHVIVQATSAS